MITKRGFIQRTALVASLASLMSLLARAADEPAKHTDFLFVQSAKGMSFDKSAGKLTLEGVSP